MAIEKFGAGQYPKKPSYWLFFGKLQGPKMKHDDSNCLVVSNMAGLFSISYMGCHPSH